MLWCSTLIHWLLRLILVLMPQFLIFIHAKNEASVYHHPKIVKPPDGSTVVSIEVLIFVLLLHWLGLRDSLPDHLAYLPTSGAVAGTELDAAISADVPADDGVGICCLYERVEGVRRGHVNKGRIGRGVQGPLLSQHHYLT